VAFEAGKVIKMEPKDENVFAQRLVDLRKKAGLTQEQLADRVGLKKKAISECENERSYPSYTVLMKMADVFDCSLDYLTGRDDRLSEIPKYCPAWLEDLAPVLETVSRLKRQKVKDFILSLDND
jgi:transcriptional regulator with XRE-family HTH domain